MEHNTKPKILVCLSGGVDSSVAAALLVKKGYDVTGAFMVNYDDAQLSPPARGGVAEGRGGGSCWRGDYQDALRVAAKLGIKLLRWDFRQEYKKDVLDYMYKEYSAGRTPNPDVVCNKFVKFGAWLDKAKELGFDYIATGHYARVVRNKEKGIRNKRAGNSFLIPYSLLLSHDTNKDQTYFLHQLTQEQLRYVLFPIGDYTKLQVRALAKKFHLPTAEKEESMGICFVGERPMKKFLEKKIKKNPGDIVDSGGNILGKHDGLAFYTVGERIGLKISNFKFQISNKFQKSNSKPMFVVEKDIKNNRLVVGHEDDPLLYKKEIQVEKVNWISGQIPKFPLKCKVRLRHRQPLQSCVVQRLSFPPCLPPACRQAGRSRRKRESSGSLIVKFAIPQRAPTPGQFAVFYQRGACLGGGEIS